MPLSDEESLPWPFRLPDRRERAIYERPRASDRGPRRASAEGSPLLLSANRGASRLSDNSTPLMLAPSGEGPGTRVRPPRSSGQILGWSQTVSESACHQAIAPGPPSTRWRLRSIFSGHWKYGLLVDVAPEMGAARQAE